MAKKEPAASAASKTTAVTRTAGTAVGAPGSWEDEMARYATASKKVADATAGAGAWITFKSGQLAFKGLPIKGNELECVVLDECLENLYYEGKYDPDQPASPVCFALARSAAELAPHATAPSKQHADCAGCPQNKFGTSDTGKGKACKNTVRLALIAYGDGSAKQIEGCEIAFAKLPVTSVKNWGKYVSSLLETSGTPPMGVVTKMSVRPDAKNQFSVNFERAGTIDGKKLGAAVLKRRREAEGTLIPEQPYQQVERGAEAAKGRAAAPARGRAKY